MIYRTHTIIALCIFLLSFSFAVAQYKTKPPIQPKVMTEEQKDAHKQLIGTKLPPSQKIKGAKEFLEAQGNSKDFLPGGKEQEVYSPEQDSMYFQAMRSRIPTATRFALELLAASQESAFLENLGDTEWSVAMKNLAMIPKSAYAPLAVDVANYEYGIQQSFYIPGIRNFRPGTMEIKLSTIGRLLGLTEDVTPTINYTVNATSDVEIIVYSMQAIVLQTMFKGRQSPGSYTLTWNLRDSNGKMMPRGDYVIEARIGNKRIRQKRVVIY